MLRFIALSLLLLLSGLVHASDYAREQKWAEEILPAVLVGEPVWLEERGGHRFLSLYTPAPGAKSAVILGHGIGVHPDWGLIGGLRQSLADKGYATLSLQFPVLAADAKAEDYPPTFDAAAARLARVVDFLKSKGYQRIAILSHSLGCRMSYRYLSGSPDAAVVTWVALSSPGTDDWGRLKLPVLDLYGQNDLPAVLKNAPARASGLKQAGSRQQLLPDADHFFEGQDAALLDAVSAYLAKTL
ncbi:MAG: DUF3530 family protein [Pseudomonadota bacterium]